MPRLNDTQPSSWDESAIRAGYEQYGVEGFYQRFGDTYRNPHERAIRAALRAAVERWALPPGRVLDLACGSGEVTLALRQLVGPAIEVDGIDPYTYQAYAERSGQIAERYTFEQIAAGALVGRSYGTIVCSFAMHLVALSRLPALATQLSQIGEALLLLTPHKRPQLRAEWGWECTDELLIERVRARLYRRSWS
ncbi:MAG TPA: class I SAM-dependent methyltransferase [Roseiflexaceae bacterium]|nr:class I SAM-dependent methyltransferase [Roseiflexaceae bacterium]